MTTGKAQLVQQAVSHLEAIDVDMTDLQLYMLLDRMSDDLTVPVTEAFARCLDAGVLDQWPDSEDDYFWDLAFNRVYDMVTDVLDIYDEL